MTRLARPRGDTRTRRTRSRPRCGRHDGDRHASPVSIGEGAILSVRGLAKSFGGLKAINDVSFDAAAGQVTALIGPNGAGKTTVFNLITNLMSARRRNSGFRRPRPWLACRR